jgi:hypothetical protein
LDFDPSNSMTGTLGKCDMTYRREGSDIGVRPPTAK